MSLAANGDDIKVENTLTPFKISIPNTQELATSKIEMANDEIVNIFIPLSSNKENLIIRFSDLDGAEGLSVSAFSGESQEAWNKTLPNNAYPPDHYLHWQVLVHFESLHDFDSEIMINISATGEKEVYLKHVFICLK